MTSAHMKRLLIVLITLLPFTGFSQADSTLLTYKYIEDLDIQTICNLSDIQVVKLACSDTLMRGKVFNLIIQEVKKGKIVNEDNFNIKNTVRKIPISIVGKDTTFYHISMVDKAGFSNQIDVFTITFAGMYKKDALKLNIRFPGLGYEKSLKGKANYQLRDVSNSEEGAIVKVGMETPILAYTPPMEAGALNSYCLLGQNDINKWYKENKIGHFYIFLIEVK